MTLKKSQSLSFYGLLAILVLCSGFLRGVLFAKEKEATLKAVKGTVEVQRGGGGAWDAASEGMLLYAQDMVRTKLSSECQIVFVGGHNIKMTALATVQIKAPRKPNKKEDPNSKPVSDAKVNIGKVFAKVKKSTGGSATKFEIATPTAVAGIRGTALALGVDESGATTCSVTEGTVAMSNDSGEEVSVSEGQQVTSDASGDLPDQSSPMSEEEKASWSSQKEWVEQVESEVEGKLEGTEGTEKITEGTTGGDEFESFLEGDSFAAFDGFSDDALRGLLSDPDILSFLEDFNQGDLGDDFLLFEEEESALEAVGSDSSFGDATFQDDTITLP